MQEKTELLEKDSYEFKQGAIKIRRISCKKIGLTIALILVVGAL